MDGRASGNRLSADSQVTAESAARGGRARAVEGQAAEMWPSHGPKGAGQQLNKSGRGMAERVTIG